MNEIVAITLLIIFGQEVPVAMPSREACIVAQRAITANGGQAICAGATSPEDLAIRMAELAALRAANKAEDDRWAGTDRAWCMGIQIMGVDRDDPRFWPYEPRCGAEPPYACLGKPTRPGPCPD